MALEGQNSCILPGLAKSIKFFPVLPNLKQAVQKLGIYPLAAMSVIILSTSLRS